MPKFESCLLAFFRAFISSRRSLIVPMRASIPYIGSSSSDTSGESRNSFPAFFSFVNTKYRSSFLIKVDVMLLVSCHDYRAAKHYSVKFHSAEFFAKHQFKPCILWPPKVSAIKRPKLQPRLAGYCKR